MKHLKITFSHSSGFNESFLARSFLDYCQVRDFAISILPMVSEVTCTLSGEEVSVQYILNLVNNAIESDINRFESSHKKVFFYQGGTRLPNALTYKWVKK